MHFRPDFGITTWHYHRTISCFECIYVVALVDNSLGLDPFMPQTCTSMPTWYSCQLPSPTGALHLLNVHFIFTTQPCNFEKLFCSRLSYIVVGKINIFVQLLPNFRTNRTTHVLSFFSLVVKSNHYLGHGLLQGSNNWKCSCIKNVPNGMSNKHTDVKQAYIC